MFKHVNKGFFPQQDTGRINGFIQADQDTSFVEMSKKMRAFVDIVRADPAVDTVTAFTGGGNGTSTARMFAQLKPLAERKIDADHIIARLRDKTSGIPGASLFLQSVQDVTVGGRFGGAQYQYTLQADNLDDLYHWAPIIMDRLRQIPELRDINSDQQNKGLQSYLSIDRDTAGRLGVSIQDIDNVLGDSFGQRQVSNIYKGLNQYHVVLEVAPEFQQNPDALEVDLCTIEFRQTCSAKQFRALRARQHIAVGQSPGNLPVHHAVVQSCAWRVFGACRGTRRRSAAAIRRPQHRPRDVPGHCAGVSGFALQSTGSHSGGARRGVYCSRDSLRKLHSSHHHSLDDSIRGHWRVAGSSIDEHGSQHHRADWNHFADRNREEERHLDDRFRGADRTRRTEAA